MKKIEWKTALPLGIVCLLAVFLQSGILSNLVSIGLIVPYLVFAICSFIVYAGKKSAINIFKILLFAFVCLPIFDFVYSMFTSVLSSDFFAVSAFVFIQTFVYFALFMFVNIWVNKKNNVLSSKIYIFSALLILLYSILEGALTVVALDAMNQAINQGALFSWLSALNGNVLIQIVSKIIFYVNVFYLSMKFVNNN